MKTKSFETIQQIIECGAEVDIKPECFLKKNSKEISILEKIYTDFREKGQVCWLVLNDESWIDIPAENYQKTLEYIRFIKPFYCWAVFVKKGNEYKTYVQGNATGKFDLMKTLKNKNKLVGTKKKVKCVIPVEEMDSVIEELIEMVKVSKTKEKPRKQYTHKQKED